MVEWILILQLELLTPRAGDVIVSSDFSFSTQESCEKHKKDFDIDVMVKRLFGGNSTYTNARLDCKQLGKDAPA